MSDTEIKLHSDIIELIELLGWELTEKLLKQYGGSRFYVCKVFESNQHLIDIIGTSATKKLTDHYQGLSLELPRCLKLFNAQRNIDIQERVANGESPDRLCIEYGITRRHVFRLLKSQPHSVVDKNLNLF